MSGIIGGAGSKSKIIGKSTVNDRWYNTFSGVVSQSAAIIDFAVPNLGSNVTESAGVVTVATAGWYYIFMSLANNAASNTAAHVYLKHENTQIQHRIYQESAGGTPYQAISASWMVEALATDTFCIYGSGNFYGASSTNNMSYWLGYRLGT